MTVAPLIDGTIAEPGDEARQLFHRLFVGGAALLGAGEFRITEHARFGVAARPRNDRGRTSGKEIDPIERAVLIVEADGAALDLVFPNVIAVQIHVERSFQFAGVRAAAGEFALAPAREEFLVHGQEVPPGGHNAFGICFDIGAARDEIEIRHVRTMAIEEEDFFEAVVSERFCDVENVIDEMLEVIIDRAREIHDVPGVTITNGWKNKEFVWNQAAGPVRNPGGTNDIDIERKMRPMLFDRATGNDADLA